MVVTDCFDLDVFVVDCVVSRSVSQLCTCDFVSCVLPWSAIEKELECGS